MEIAFLHQAYHFGSWFRSKASGTSERTKNGRCQLKIIYVFRSAVRVNEPFVQNMRWKSLLSFLRISYFHRFLSGGQCPRFIAMSCRHRSTIKFPFKCHLRHSKWKKKRMKDARCMNHGRGGPSEVDDEPRLGCINDLPRNIMKNSERRRNSQLRNEQLFMRIRVAHGSLHYRKMRKRRMPHNAQAKLVYSIETFFLHREPIRSALQAVGCGCCCCSSHHLSWPFCISFKRKNSICDVPILSPFSVSIFCIAMNIFIIKFFRSRN